MIILGLSHLSPSPSNHDSSVALLEDGILRSAVSEERFSRVKHDGAYQARSIQYCLEEAGVSLSEVDKIAVGFGIGIDLMENRSKNRSSLAKTDQIFRNTPIESKKPIFYNHQYTHVRTAYSLTNFSKAVAVSLDGRGYDDGKPTSGGVFVIEEGKIEPIMLYPGISSLGFVYGCLTEICGFQMVDGEGKTMTLAAFGEKESQDQKTKVYEHVKNLFPKFKGIEYVEGGVLDPLTKFVHNVMLYKNADPRITLIGKLFKKELIAWAAQKVLEELVVKLIIDAVEFTGIKNVVLSGGIFLNMIMNMKIRQELGKNYDIFFNPICGDFGNAIGAAFEQYYVETGRNSSHPNMPLYLGPSYDNGEVTAAINRLNLKFEKINKVHAALDLIEKGNVIGWFQGRSEFGPRALGNRSILSLTTQEKFKDIVNDKVKKRESWRPFCPTISQQKSSHFLENVTNSPYMILGYHMKNPHEAPAVCHIDGSCRPQILDRKDNRDFFDVVQGLDGIVLNTSFNLAGEPIVETPLNALLTFKNSGMDALIINDFIIKR